MFSHVIFLALMGGALCQNTRPDIETALSKRPHYSMLLDLLKSANLLDTLKAMPNMTLFAPNNQALSDIPNDEYNQLKNDPTRLADFLKYHVTAGSFHAGNSGRDKEQVFTSLNNNLPIRVNNYGQLHTVAAEGCNITEKNIGVANGFIQGIDDVMNAPHGDVVDVIKGYPETQILAKLIHDAGLESAIKADQNITVFAPTDEAWNNLDQGVRTYLQQNPKLLKEVLLYHVVPKMTLYSIGMRHSMVFETSDSHKDSLVLLENDDDDLFIDHAEIGDRDLSGTNGVVHTIDDFLLPTSVLVELEDQGFGHLLG